MNQNVTCFTGHRNKSFSFKYDETHSDCIRLKAVLKEQIIKLIEIHNVKRFISGLALGVDQFAAEIVIDLKKEYPDIILEAALPCLYQSVKWSQKQRERYDNILSKCDAKTVRTSGYTNDCMMNRKQYMVDHSDIVLTVWNGQRWGGTYKTICYDRDKKNKIFILNSVKFTVAPEI